MASDNKSSESNRRKFLGTAAGVAAFTIVPRHVLGGPGVVAPSDKITLAHIGTGTEGLREILPLLAAPEIQIVSVCDPCKFATGYRDWSKDGLLKDLRRDAGQAGLAGRDRSGDSGRPGRGAERGGYVLFERTTRMGSRAVRRTRIIANSSRKRRTWTP